MNDEDDDDMEILPEDDEEQVAADRWTCEACGCNTNQAADRSCTICGTSNAGPALLRRNGFAARWIAGRMGRADEAELWESVMDGMVSQQQQQQAPPVVNAAAVLTAANAVAYSPVWQRQVESPVQWGPPLLGETAGSAVAHLPAGAAEGHVVRAEQALPRTFPVVGFRIAFSHASATVGGNMGGNHLIGVTTSHFTAYDDALGLQQSPFFWGIEDSGQKFEGRTAMSNSNRRRAAAAAAALLGGRDDFCVAPLNASNALFGSQDVITVVCDFETRTLTFWRDGVLLGTLVTHLPRTGHLYPVAVPFQSGVTVAITSLTEDPRPLLLAFSSNCLRSQQDQEKVKRQIILVKRNLLLHGSSPSPRLTAVLQQIFASYATLLSSSDELPYAQACRLWYRCGLELSCLDALLQEKGVARGNVNVNDFLATVGKVIAAEGVAKVNCRSCEVDDMVELVDNFQKYGDSSGGPLLPGDRGKVVEIQNGPNGDCRSVRVFHNGRRWWYQPHAVVSESSGLIDSPATWFLSRLLRAHGYDSETLESLEGKPLRVGNFKMGDYVKPAKWKGSDHQDSSACMLGRIAPAYSSAARSKLSREGSVHVEFVSHEFADAVGIKLNSESDKASQVFGRRVRLNKLVFASPSTREGEERTSQNDQDVSGNSGGASLDQRTPGATISAKMQSELAMIEGFDLSAIESVGKICKRSPDSLATLFSGGLPEAVHAALDIAAKQMKSLEPREDLGDKIGAIGRLVSAMAEKLYNVQQTAPTVADMEPEVNPTFAEEAETGSASLSIFGRPRGNQPDRRVPRGVDAISRAASRDSQGAGDDPASLLSSSLQRRGMLLSLLSSGRQRSGRDLGPAEGRIMLEATSLGVRSPFVSQLAANEQGRNLPWESSNVEESDFSSSNRANKQDSVLETMLRCRGGGAEAVSRSLRQGGPSLFTFVRHLVWGGVLVNSHAWLQALIESHQSKKTLSGGQRGVTSLLKLAVDEDGTSVLRVALLCGCDVSIVRQLLSCGAAVEARDVELACATDQHQSLSVLLQYAPFCEEMVSLAECSKQVQAVVGVARSRQNMLDRQMRDAAGEYISSVVRKLVALGLDARRNQSARSAVCAKAVVDILVGDVLLVALKKVQSSNDSVTDPVSGEGNNAQTTGALFDYLPSAVVQSALFSDAKSAATFLLLLEEYVCSKIMSDAAAGLALCTYMLTHCPFVCSSVLPERYGLLALVSNHDVLASKRMSKVTTASLTGDEAAPGMTDDSNQATSSHKGTVLCPKCSSAAVLHVTRHSSFRCDMCGSGVDRGQPMHGCRDCDWDACEECTDKSESGVIKCATIRKMSNACVCLLSSEVRIEESYDEKYMNVIHEMCSDESVSSLNRILFRLSQFDVEAVHSLGTILQEPGKVTFHQFLSLVLPALHSVLTGRSSENDGDSIASRSTPKKKKPRVVGCPDLSTLSPDARFDFCRAAVLKLIEDPLQERKMNVDSASAVAEPSLGSGSSSIQKEIAYSPAASELLRRIHQVLALYEDVNSSPLVGQGLASGENNRGSLYALTKALGLQLVPFPNTDTPRKLRQIHVSVQPLLSFKEVEDQIVRSFPLLDSSYLMFCRGLVEDQSVIVEKNRSGDAKSWRIARVVDFTERTGSHRLRYALPIERPGEALPKSTVCSVNDLSVLRFEGRVANVVLAVRDYFVIHRVSAKKQKSTPQRVRRSPRESRSPNTDCPHRLAQAVGSRVESNTVDGSWQVYTLSSIDIVSRCVALVSDDGCVYTMVPESSVRLPKRSAGFPGSFSLEPGSEGRSRTLPFNSVRDRISGNVDGPCVMCRRWSAISLATSMRPVDIVASQDGQPTVNAKASKSWSCTIGTTSVTLSLPVALVETPPVVSVHVSLSDQQTPQPIADSGDKTILQVLVELHGDEQLSADSGVPVKLYYSVFADSSSQQTREARGKSASTISRIEIEKMSASALEDSWQNQTHSRARKLNARSLSPPTCSKELLCEGLDEVCVRCMDMIHVLSLHADDNTEKSESDEPQIPGFANPSVVSSTIPSWCAIAPALAPRCFSYDARQTLLKRVAFGVSRSTLKQQEAKVNVGRLRQRMHSLRARAVELMGEAFSGGAEDPTALQLQADELYGMEENLANRVRAAFRASNWQEHSLEVAKAAVRRDNLLADADSIMESYARDNSVNRRRLEVRFEGETGFDAASGDEAGVTRGFYADVAECLLSSDNIASIQSTSTCARLPSMVKDSDAIKDPDAMSVTELEEEPCKLPMWIPDMDASGQVVIPTPRADKRSGLGVFPRPIPSYHPQMDEVLQQFRFMGRLFAAAQRDSFMFPLPLSAAFLKLVQHGTISKPEEIPGWEPTPTEYMLLGTSDLPRPGFLGGEVYAAESFVCRTLDELDACHPPLSRLELQRRYKNIATDKNFARTVFGATYDCTFEDYYQDRTFVDPLDPSQGEEAAPLCRGGHKKPVTIYNVREWVALAKSFLLQDGVISQALAFRQGVEDFFPSHYLNVFTAEELQRDVCGTGDNVETWDEGAVRKLFKLNGGKGAAEALVAVAAIGGEGGAALSRRFSPSSQTIVFLVKALIEATPKQRRQFLSFVTSVPIVTPGRIQVVPIVSPSGNFLPMQDPTCLPRANTCTRRLYLPKFDDFDSFAKVLWAVVREESRFKGFYEWRGSS